MKICDDLTEQRSKTISFWSGFSYPNTEQDIARVYAFRELDPETATNEDVTKAYGGPGWAHIEPCAECGSESQRVEIGCVVLCVNCINQAAAMFITNQQEPPAPAAQPKKSLFSRLTGA